MRVRTSWPELPFARLRFQLQAERPARLPVYKGSMLRGAFGQALRRQFCLAGADVACGGCGFRHGCAYAQLYEPLPSDARASFVAGRPAAPRPYIVEVLDSRRELAAGDRLPFVLTLFGGAIAWQAHAQLAATSMARHGLGADRHRFRLVATEFEAASSTWRPLGNLRTSDPAPARLPDLEERDVTRAVLRFVTPTRVLRDGRPLKDFPLRTVIEKASRRALELAHFHTPTPVQDWDLDPLLTLADRVRVVDRQTRWLDLPRFSNRQRRRMTLGGIVGRWTLEGPLTTLTPALRLAEVVHVGKAASFGFGKVMLELG